MADAFANLAASLVATAPSPATSGTSLVVTTGEGAVFPAAPFNAVAYNPTGGPTMSNAEIVRVTAVSTDTLTITRAQEGTTAKSIAVGWVIAATLTKKSADDLAGNNPWLVRSATDAPHVVRGSAAGVANNIFEWHKQDDSAVAAIGALAQFLEGGRRVTEVTSRLTSVATIASATNTSTGLLVALGAGKAYHVKAGGLWQTTAVASTYTQRFNYSGTITTLMLHARLYQATGATPTYQDQVATANTTSTPAATAAVLGTNYWWEWEGIVVANAAGNLTLEHARAAGTGTITLAIGSYLKALELA